MIQLKISGELRKGINMGKRTKSNIEVKSIQEKVINKENWRIRPNMLVPVSNL